MKKLKYFIFCMFVTSLFVPKMHAAGISIYSSKSNATVGDKIVITVKTSDPMGSYRLTTSNAGVVAFSGSTSGGFQTPSEQAQYTVTAKSVGSATISFVPVNMASYSSETSYTQISSVTINVKAKPVIVLSKDNSLASLGIEGKELTPGFSKDTLEYSVELEPDTTKVNVVASPSNSGASINGAGEREVQDGPNKLEIVVTAENGSSRTYVINATVKEFDPIKVKVDGIEYTVVRKKSGLGEVNGYEATTVDINGTEVPALKSQVTGYTLVALKDEQGNQNYYIKDKDNYILYKEYTFNKVVLVPLPWNKNLIPSNYKKYTITYNDSKIEAYKLNKKSKYALIYGVNAETGVENIYMYDSVEDTLQIYNQEETKSLTNDKHLYLKLTLGLGVLAFIELIVLISVLVSTKKRNKVKVKQLSEKVD